MKKLKTCPFCGGNATNVEKNEDFGEFTVTCWSCLFDGPHGKNKSEAIAIWNRRVYPPHNELIHLIANELGIDGHELANHIVKLQYDALKKRDDLLPGIRQYDG